MEFTKEMEGKRAEEVKEQGCLDAPYVIKLSKNYQALGGHKTSHTKPHKPKAEKDGSQKHQCFMCNTEFDKGQALGGHMRCHMEELLRRKAQAQEQPSKEVNKS
ncbi:hypothetical protein AMTR_s00018p00217070 [Amborella trichopoda]|uniref:C2H2-type domain-containing protein n=1 Tax=Amborella trichopoda TaxID=13333 RepID=W1PE77_AMBTC|nr:hypothetical protein AMTR_s00018p00217070 [Amborella trichopoda]